MVLLQPYRTNAVGLTGARAETNTIEDVEDGFVIRPRRHGRGARQRGLGTRNQQDERDCNLAHRDGRRTSSTTPFRTCCVRPDRGGGVKSTRDTTT